MLKGLRFSLRSLYARSYYMYWKNTTIHQHSLFIDQLSTSTTFPGKYKAVSRTVARVEGRIPLPAISSENHLRPFFHATPKSNNPILATMKNFAKYRGIEPRDNAIQCMTMASTFKDKPWLRQVDLAISLASRGVTRGVIELRGRHQSVKALPTIAASPVKANS